MSFLLSAAGFVIVVTVHRRRPVHQQSPHPRTSAKSSNSSVRPPKAATAACVCQKQQQRRASAKSSNSGVRLPKAATAACVRQKQQQRRASAKSSNSSVRPPKAATAACVRQKQQQRRASAKSSNSGVRPPKAATAASRGKDRSHTPDQDCLLACLLKVPGTCQCFSGTDLHRQFYVLPR